MNKPLYTLMAFLFVSCFVLSGCGSKKQDVTTDFALELDAKDSATTLTPEEVAALKTEGEIDRNLPKSAMNDVTKQFCYYLGPARKHIKASIKRGEKYLPYARGIFEKEGLPKDLAYLAIVESGYRTNAKSPSGAAGTWQFMKRTGTAYGLDQDTWTDDRYDFYEATEAAATYLKKLFKDFRDWPTAIAAYNSGEGKMRRAMEASGSANFFEVRERNDSLSDQLKLKEETKQYVPRFLAVAKIMRNLGLLNLPQIDTEQAYQVTRVTARPGTDLKALAQELSVTWEEMQVMNTHHLGEVSSAVRDTHLYVPSDKAEKAKQLLATNYEGKYKGWKTSAVQKQETWKNLEKRYHVSSETLRRVNPGCSLKTGELIFLPGNVVTAALEQQKSTKAHGTKKGSHIVHVLKSKETLYAVSKKYNVSPMTIMNYNDIQDPRSISAGTKLRIPTSESATVASGTAYGSLGSRKPLQLYYVVQSKDTMWKISKQFNVSVEQLKEWNKLSDSSLQVGARLVVNAE